MRQTAARRGSHALDSGAAMRLCALAPSLDSGRPHIASRLGRRLSSGAASSCALDSGAARQLCALALLSTRGLRLSPPISVAVGAAARQGSYALDSGVARRLYADAALDPRRPSVASHFCRRQYSGAVRSVSVAVWTAARRGSYALDSGAAMRLCAGAAS